MSAARTIATSAANVSTALAACEYSYCHRATSNDSGGTVQKAGRGIDRVGKRPEEALSRYKRDKRSERQCEGRAVGARHQRVRQRRQQRDADHDPEQRPAGIDLLHRQVLSGGQRNLVR